MLLKRLEKEGWVCSTFQPQETRPSKRVFSLMPLGETRFREWLNSPTDHVRDLRIEFLAKLYFFKELDLERGSGLVAAQIAVLDEIKERLAAKRRAEQDAYKRLVYSFRISILKAWLTWLKEEAAPFVR